VSGRSDTGELEKYLIGYVEPVKLIMQYLTQAAIGHATDHRDDCTV